MRLAVGHEPEVQQPLRQVGGGRGGRDLPRASAAPSRPNVGPDLLDLFLEPLGGEAQPLHDGVRGVAAGAEPDHVALVLDALLTGLEQRVGVRVLGELEHDV